MRSFFRRLRRKSYSVSLDKAQGSFVYRERGRQLKVAGEAMPDGWAVYASSIRQWESGATEVIGDNDRLRIASNIRAYYVDRGQNIYLS
jgi:hypothetical protein